MQHLGYIRNGIRQYGGSLFWGLALLALFLMNPENTSISLCPLKAMNLTWCPGCGIGHGIHYALHGNFSKSIHSHYLGIPAALILVFQTIKTLPLKTIKQVSWTNNKF